MCLKTKTIVFVAGAITAVCVTQNGTLLLVDRKTKTVFEYRMTSDRYRFSPLSKFGQETLTDPLDCVQMKDGRVAVTDGKDGHSVKVCAVH